MAHPRPAETFRGINNQLITRYKDGFYDNILCEWYDPCPICRRCMNRFQSKYDHCLDCGVKTCTHTTEERNRMMQKGG